jgi:RimJ/RimL family protein N-acetyltransferase
MNPLDEHAAITTERLILAPLQAEDADELATVLADERLHEFIGGRPATLAELRERYMQLAAGSGDPGELWLNWTVRRRADAQAVGTMQATLVERAGQWSASVAWVVGLDFQGHGYASEAARALVGWLREQGMRNIEAHIHPDHHASAHVAANAGLQPTAAMVDGERVWRLP